VTCIIFHVVLNKGKWRRQAATEANLREQLERFFKDDFGNISFIESPDDDVAVEVDVSTFYEDGDDLHAESLRDCLIQRLLRCMKPEYDSMVEVEVSGR
jgi:hypothetical protein